MIHQHTRELSEHNSRTKNLDFNGRASVELRHTQDLGEGDEVPALEAVTGFVKAGDHRGSVLPMNTDTQSSQSATSEAHESTADLQSERRDPPWLSWRSWRSEAALR